MDGAGSGDEPGWAESLAAALSRACRPGEIGMLFIVADRVGRTRRNYQRLSNATRQGQSNQVRRLISSCRRGLRHDAT